MGIILFNVVFILIYMVARLIGKNVYTLCVENCDAPEKDCFNGKCGKHCGGLTRIRNRLPYVFWYNLIGFIIIVLSLLIEQIVLKFPIEEYVVSLAVFFLLELALCYGLNKK